MRDINTLSQQLTHCLHRVALCLALVSVLGSTWAATSRTEVDSAIKELSDRSIYLHSKGDLSSAISALERALELATIQSSARSGTAGFLRGQMGVLYDQMGLVDKAIEHYAGAIEILKSVPQANEHTWKLRYNLAGALGKVKRWDEARNIYLLLLDHYSSIRGPSDELTIGMRLLVAGTYHGSGQHERAIEQFLIALDQTRSTLGPNHPDTIDREASLANAYSLAHKWNQALDAYKNVFVKSESVLGSTHKQTLEIGYGYALNLSTRDRVSEGLPIAEKVLRGHEVLGDDVAAILAARHLYGVLLTKARRWNEAEIQLRRGLETAERERGISPKLLASFLNGLAELYIEMGRLPEARDYFERVVKLAEHVYGVDSDDVVVSRTALASAIERMGHAEEAQQQVEQAFSILERRRGLRDPLTLVTMARLVNSYYGTGALSQARAYGEKAYPIMRQVLGPDSPDTLDLARTLSGVYLREGEHSKALSVMEESVRNIADSKSSISIFLRRDLARTYLVVGQIELAQKTASAVLNDALSRNESPSTISGIVEVIALILMRDGPSEAAPLLEIVYAESVQRLGGHHPDTITALAALMMAYGKNNDGRHVQVHDRLLETIEQWWREAPQLSENRIGQYSTMTIWLKLAISWLAAQSSTGRHEFAFELADKIKVRTSLERLAMRQLKDVTSTNRVKVEELDLLEKQIGGLEIRLAEESNLGDQARVAAERRKLVLRHSAIIRELTLGSPDIARLLNTTVTAKELSGRLAEDAAFLSYVWTQDSGEVIVLRRNQPALLTRLPWTPRLRDAIHAAKEVARLHPVLAGTTWDRLWQDQDGAYYFGRRRPGTQVREVADPRELYRALGKALLEPIAQEIRGKKTLIISPDAELVSLPFEVLEFDGRYLIETFDISYAGSGAMYVFLAEKAARHSADMGQPFAKDLLVVGAPEYTLGATIRSPAASEPKSARDLPQGLAVLRGNRPKVGSGRFLSLRDQKLEWNTLLGSEREVGEVSTLFDQGRRHVLTGKNASEASLRALNDSDELMNFRYLLFSTHGHISSEDPRLNALVLSQTETTDQVDGYVTAAELAGYKMRPEVLFLSACDTGVGRFVPGEGVQSLASAATLSGAINTVFSLWAAIDETTALFVSDFFRRLKDGMSPRRALSETKRQFIRDENLRLPLLWAPFVLYGN